MSEGKTLIFFHIAKTAGTTLDTIIRDQFPQDSVYVMNGSLNPQCVTEFKSLPPENKAEVRYLHAHLVPFGIHEFLPQQPIYVTLLRNPVERVISRYFHHLRRPEDAVHDGVKDLSLQEYATSGVLLGDTQSGQTRGFSGVKGEDWIIASGPLSHDILGVAKANLRQHFTVVGLTERFDESLILLKRAIGWRTKDILYVKQQVGRNRPPKNKISSETVKLIEDHNELDMQLYEFAKQMFEERISQESSSFRRELQIFRLCNKIYGCIMNVKSELQMGADLSLGLVRLLLALVRGEVQFSHVYNKVKAAIRKRR